MMREKRDIRPVLLKYGVALALTFGGILYNIFRNKRIKPYKSPPSDCGNQVELAGEKVDLNDDNHSLPTTLDSYCTDSVEPEKHEQSHLLKITTENAFPDLSPSSSSCQDQDETLLPEFRELVNGFSLAAAKASNSRIEYVETPKKDVKEIDYYEQEINSLRNMVRDLKENERTLENQLLEYYGLKEQETAVMELQNRLKIHNLETKLFTVKIESLQADNKRLEAQVADNAKVVAELDEARANIKLLKRRLCSEAERNKEQILSFQQRLAKLQEQDYKNGASDVDKKMITQKLKDLEEEVDELRKSNYKLRMENSNLAQKLESTQVLVTSTAEDKALKEESYRLRQENENLSEKIEQLQTDRCGDAEEFVYLRWINACLRYELRNFQAGPGETVASDLSTTISPESEEKAKQLILEYASKEGFAEKGTNLLDFDSEQWSRSSVSHLTESADFDASSVGNSSADRTSTWSKRNFISKFNDLKHGKDSYNHSRCSSVDTNGSFELGNSSIHASELQRLKNVKTEDLKDSKGVGGHLGVYRRIGSAREGNNTKYHQDNLVDEGPETCHRSELLKYAKVLEDSTSKYHRRSASYI